SPVLMVYGLDQAKMNCDRVFNIFCLYGNVEKVKFMKSKPGAAMVEMADGYAVDRAITHLNNNFMFGQKLNV
ncbi:HNRPL protein, partial [Piaya cayana]|nr:HNRPL protein [Piaya cayana]